MQVERLLLIETSRADDEQNRKKVHIAPHHIARPTIDETLDLEKFPEQFEALADNIVVFGRCLNEFPEFTDDAVNASITSFESDLRVGPFQKLKELPNFQFPVLVFVFTSLSRSLAPISLKLVN